MKISEVKNELYAIGKTFPTVMGLLTKPLPNGGQTVGAHWAAMLADLDGDHLENVCHEYATMERRLPDDLSQLALEIHDEVCQRVSRDHERLESLEKQAQGRRTNAMALVKEDRTGKISIMLAEQVKAGVITKEENEGANMIRHSNGHNEYTDPNCRMAQLMDWHHGKCEPPEWLEAILTTGPSDV